MSRWFRHYAGMVRDDKLVRAAVKCGQTIERVVWIYGAILESAAEVDDGGRYDIDTAEIAYFLRADESDVGAVEAALTDAGRLAEGRVVKWGDRQYQSDRSASRTAAYRERKRQGDGGRDNHQEDKKRQGDETGTSPHKPGDVHVTSQHRRSDAPETETETETEKKQNNPPSQARGAVVSLRPEEPEEEIPAILDRRAYPDKFEAVWDEYKPIASKNATKADAFKAWQKLSEADKAACYSGVVEYAMWLLDERKKRPDTPAKHLATFINKRGWEPFEEADHATG